MAAKIIRGKRVKLQPRLHVNDGFVTVWHGDLLEPLEMSEEEACRRLLVFGDLLAACEAVDNHLKTTFPPYESGKSPYDLIRAALAKARGQ